MGASLFWAARGAPASEPVSTAIVSSFKFARRVQFERLERACPESATGPPRDPLTFPYLAKRATSCDPADDAKETLTCLHAMRSGICFYSLPLAWPLLT